jgi:hypothetical protein
MNIVAKTVVGVDTGRASLRGRRWRRAATAAIAVVVGAGATGVLGVRTETLVRRLDDGTVVSLDFARIARPGLAVPWRILVESPTGFSAPIRVSISSSYLDAFDHNLLTPDAATIERSADLVLFEFDRPSASSFEMSLDMRLEPGVQWKRDADVTVEIGGDRVTRFSYTTWVLP